MLIRSAILERRAGLQHAFSTRRGGVSRGVFESLNLGRTVGDDPTSVDMNRRRFTLEAGLGEPDHLAEVSQVHGATVARATVDNVRSGELARLEADAVFTETPGLAVAVRTADCAPVLIAAFDGDEGLVRAVAAVHAGWRGAVQGVVAAAVDALAGLGLEPRHMCAAIGPTIGPDAFEVGPEVIALAEQSLEPEPVRARPGPRGRPLLDLPHLIRRHLVTAGLPDDGIDDLGLCTVDDPSRFFSHRRDHGRTGRHLSALRIVP